MARDDDNALRLRRVAQEKSLPLCKGICSDSNIGVTASYRPIGFLQRWAGRRPRWKNLYCGHLLAMKLTAAATSLRKRSIRSNSLLVERGALRQLRIFRRGESHENVRTPLSGTQRDALERSESHEEGSAPIRRRHRALSQNHERLRAPSAPRSRLACASFMNHCVVACDLKRRQHARK